MEIRKARDGEAKQVVSLIQKRIDWMDEHGLSQWNKANYLAIYPLSYFEMRLREGTLFVAAEGEKVIGGMAVLEEDPRWKADKAAFYIHHLAADPMYPGTGKKMLEFVEEYARERGKEAVRLDSKKDVRDINQFYDSLGYETVGECRDGGYVGNLREKAVVKKN